MAVGQTSDFIHRVVCPIPRRTEFDERILPADGLHCVQPPERMKRKSNNRPKVRGSK